MQVSIQSHNTTSILSQWLPDDQWVSTFSSHQKTSKYQQFTLGQKIPQHFSYHSCLLMQRIYWTSINLDQKIKTNIFFYDAVWYHSYTKVQNIVYSFFAVKNMYAPTAHMRVRYWMYTQCIAKQSNFDLGRCNNWSQLIFGQWVGK